MQPIEQFTSSNGNGQGMGSAMELFRAVKFGDLEARSLRECSSCKKNLRLIKVVFYAETEETIRMFECDCGERIWDE